MKLIDVSKEELNHLKAKIEDEAWACLYKYQDENDLTDDNVDEYFDEAMEDLYSEDWVEFLDKYNIEAEYEVSYAADVIYVDFWDIQGG